MSPLQAMLFTWFHGSILPTLLCNFDRASMTHGIEVRMPFMDWRLVTYSFALPETSKIGGGYTKRVLREAMRGLLPEPIRLRTKKIGFVAPMEVLGSRRAKTVAAGSKRKPFLHRELGVEWTRGKSGGRAGSRRKSEHRSRLAHTQCVCARASLQGSGERVRQPRRSKCLQPQNLDSRLPNFVLVSRRHPLLRYANCRVINKRPCLRPRVRR